MSNFLPLDNLIIPEDRQRREFDEKHIEDLADSIAAAQGLLHAPVLRNDHKTLVAGECRTRAVRLLHERGIPFTYAGELVPAGYLPFTPLGELTEDELVEAELDENIKRRDLPWQDRVAAVARLETLRKKQASESGQPYRQREVAAEILGVPVTESGTAQKELREARILSAYLDDEDVAKAKTTKDALKVVEKKRKAEHRAKLAEAFSATLTDERFPHTLHHGRFEDWITQLPDASFDGILTDPPYGVNADKFSDQADAKHEYEDTEEYALSLYKILAEQGARVCKPEAHLYAFCDIGLFYQIKDIFAASGWTVWYRPLLWFKGNSSGMLPAPEYGPRNTYEAIIYCRRGGRKTRCVGPDIFTTPALARPTFGAQKPVELYEEILSRSFDPGDKILDTFAGAGPIFRAASALSCHATGIELNKEKIDYVYSTFAEEEIDL